MFLTLPTADKERQAELANFQRRGRLRMQILETDRLGRRFGRRWALRGIDLSVQEGEIVGLWGGSGSGKSTLLHLLSTLLRPSEGRATIEGHDLRNQPSRVRSVVSIALQTATLDADLTLAQALELRAAMLGVSRSQRTARTFELLPLVDLEGASDVTVSQLSDSERRRAELVAALLAPRRLYLLDEPFSALDGRIGRRVWDYLLVMRAQERSTVLLTTMRPEVAGQCHRIAVLSAGRLMAVDTPDIIRGAAGSDTVTVKPLDERLTARRLHERLQVNVTEEADGYRIEVERGDRVAADILSSFSGQTAAIYVRRPSLEAGLQRVAEGKLES